MSGRAGLAWDTGPWCAKCGHPSAVTGASLDPIRPLGVCGRVIKDRPGCGRVVLTTIQAEAEAVFDARRRRLATARHRLHEPDHYPVPYCTECDRASVRLALPDTGTTTGSTLAPAAAIGRSHA